MKERRNCNLFWWKIEYQNEIQIRKIHSMILIYDLMKWVSKFYIISFWNSNPLKQSLPPQILGLTKATNKKLFWWKIDDVINNEIRSEGDIQLFSFCPNFMKKYQVIENNLLQFSLKMRKGLIVSFCCDWTNATPRTNDYSSVLNCRGVLLNGGGSIKIFFLG